MQMREKLVSVFLEKNKQLNLSAIRDEEGVMIRHIEDSRKLVELGMIKAGDFVIDVGTGGGFPLMPMAMSCPEAGFLGIDSVRKKTVAVNEMLAELGVSNAEVIWTRIEEYQGAQADFVTARAVAYVDQLITWAYPLLKKGGAFLLMKQWNEEEFADLLDICEKKGLKLRSKLEYRLFDEDIQRVIYVIEKL